MRRENAEEEVITISKNADEGQKQMGLRRSQEPIELIDPRLLSPAPIGELLIQNSKDVVVGTKISYITVDNTEKVKGRFLGLELVSSVHRSPSIGCSFAICAFWVLVLVAGLLLYLLYYIIVVRPKLIDLVLACWTFMVHIVKNTSRAERYSCAVIALLLIVCLTLGIYFSVRRDLNNDEEPDGPDKWFINRTEWLAKVPSGFMDPMHQPIPLVVINHSVSPVCYNFKDCAAQMRYLQRYSMVNLNYSDTLYSFVVGNDGRVYEGRGWVYAAAHTKSYNLCALGVGFLGDYRSNSTAQTVPTIAQIENFHKLMDYGVQMGYLRRDYVVIGHCDIYQSETPGDKLYNVMTKWEHYDKARYARMTCAEIISINEE